MRVWKTPRGKGFTLIELAIVLVVLGILAGIGAGILGLLIKRIHYNQNRERIQANVESLVGYALLNRGRLLPADNCTLVLRNRRDVWGKDFLCVIAPELVNDSACARKTTSLTVIDENDNATHSDVALVLISGGPNYNIQTTNASPVRIYLPETAGVDDYPADLNRPEPYDDMVRYVSLTELQTKLKCPYTEEYLRILNNELPYGFENSTYNATVYAEGGVPFTSGGRYRWCVEDPNGVDATGLDFLCGGASALVSANCTAEAESNWSQCDELLLTGTPTVSGSFQLTFFVRDNNDPSGSEDNLASKTLVLTVNPVLTTGGGGTGGGGCTSYTVYNNCSPILYWGCVCASICRWNFGSTQTISSGSVNIYRSLLLFICDVEGVVSFSAAASADADGDCEVNYVCSSNLTDR